MLHIVKQSCISQRSIDIAQNIHRIRLMVLIARCIIHLGNLCCDDMECWEYIKSELDLLVPEK